MKIINAGQHYFIKGGSDAYMINLENLLKKKGHEVIPFASSNSNNRKSKYTDDFPKGVDTKNPKYSDYYRFIYSRTARRSIKDIIDNENIDIAHLHIYYAQLTTSILATLKKAGIPIVQSLHDFKLSCPVYSFVSNGEICEDCATGGFYRALTKKCNQGSTLRTIGSVIESYISRFVGDVKMIDKFIAVTEFQRTNLINSGTVSPDKITTLHNFIDTAEYEPSFESEGYLLYFGRLEKIKGIKTLIRAMKPLVGSKLLIVGDGSERPALEHYATAEKIDNVSFLGFQSGDDLRQLIQNSLCTILPSECYELCPLTVLESFAYGKPVIGANIGGIPELIENNRSGLLFESGNAEDLREKIEYVLNNKNKIVEMGKEALVRVKEKFNPEIHYAKLRQIYSEVK